MEIDKMKKGIYDKWRQGDVLLIKVDEIPSAAKPKKSNVVVEGEATEDVYKEWHEKLIRPLIDKFLGDTEKWDSDISHRYW